MHTVNTSRGKWKNKKEKKKESNWITKFSAKKRKKGSTGQRFYMSTLIQTRLMLKDYLNKTGEVSTS